jgi:hypothetical protein
MLSHVERGCQNLLSSNDFSSTKTHMWGGWMKKIRISSYDFACNEDSQALPWDKEVSKFSYPHMISHQPKLMWGGWMNKFAYPHMISHVMRIHWVTHLIWEISHFWGLIRFSYRRLICELIWEGLRHFRTGVAASALTTLTVITLVTTMESVTWKM